MANWWDEAPLVEDEDWWRSAPVVDTPSPAGTNLVEQAGTGATAERGFGAALYDNLIGADDGVQSYGESFGTWLNRGGETASLGLVGDEAGAAAYGMLPGRSYEGELERLRANEEGMSTAGRVSADLVGSIAPALLGLGVASGARSIWGAMGRGAGFGAGAGATTGFMEGEGGFGDRALDAVLGGGIGAGIGAAIPAAGAGVQRVMRALSDARRNRAVGRGIGGALGVSDDAGRVLGDFLAPDDPAAMRQALQAAGPDAMLADASPTASGMADAYMRSPTPGARIAGERITARAGAAGDDLIDALSGYRQGPRMPPVAQQRAMGAAARERVHPLYQRAYDTPIDYSGEAGRRIEDIFERLPEGPARRALQTASDRMVYDGVPNAQIMARIGDDGRVAFDAMPNVMQLDYIKRGFDEIAEASKDAVTGRMSPDGAFAARIARDLREAVRGAVPEYGDALAAAASDIRSRGAVQAGQRLLRPQTTVEEIVEAVGDATPAELRAMRDGVRAQMDHVIGNVRAVASDQNIDARQALTAFRDLSSPNSQRKMEALFGDDFPGIRESLDRASAALGLRARTAANSMTNPRGVFQEATTEAVTPNSLMRGRPIPAAGDAFATLMNSNPEAIRRASRDVQSELADLLTRPGQGPAALNTVTSVLARRPVNQAAGAPARNVIEALLYGHLGRLSEEVSPAVRSTLGR